jgi:hypothetical protein
MAETKNWTWVLERQCPYCGFDASACAAGAVPEVVQSGVAALRRVLDDSTTEELRTRPDAATWSPLEYAAHCRDVLRVMLARLNLMIVLDGPEFASWDQDATAAGHNYQGEDPASVSATLSRAGQGFADAFADVPLADLGRVGRRGDGYEFTILTLAQYALHDVLHHVWDVTGTRFSSMV